jgi:hypothetical protein
MIPVPAPFWYDIGNGRIRPSPWIHEAGGPSRRIRRRMNKNMSRIDYEEYLIKEPL